MKLPASFRVFSDLKGITPSETSDRGDYYNPWRRDQRWRDWEETPFEEPGGSPHAEAPEGYAAVPQTSEAGDDHAPAPHSPAGSPNRTRQLMMSPMKNSGSSGTSSCSSTTRQLDIQTTTTWRASSVKLANLDGKWKPLFSFHVMIARL